MATLTVCEQAALDLAALKKARLDRALNGRVTRVQDGDQEMEFGGTLAELDQMIRLKQIEVDRCNGVRSRGRFIRSMPVDC